ncbi:MAG TPA: AAA family ATPase [Jatrophihabitans sp.]|jgi:DNA repair exonuclease SbcCD ATPase subunit
MTDTNESRPSPVVFKRIRIEAFRGFAAATEIDLDASVVIVYGPNGLGKTSLFDAFQWVLLGELARLRESRLRPSEEYIVNAYRPGSVANVQLQLSLAGEDVTLVREGDRNGAMLTWTSPSQGRVSGEAAEALLARTFTGGPDLDLAASLNACGLLQQDESRRVLTSKPRARFEVFSQLLGLGDLGDVEVWAKSSVDDAARQLRDLDQQLASAERSEGEAAAQLATVISSATTRPLVAEVSERLGTLLRNAEFDSEAEAATRADAAAIATAATATAREASDISREVRELLTLRDTLPAVAPAEAAVLSERVGLAEQGLSNARSVHQAATDELERLRQAQQSIARMASAVLPHIDSDSCPVCTQQIDPDQIRARLHELERGISSADAEQRVATSAAAVDRARRALAEAGEARQEHARALGIVNDWQIRQARAESRLVAMTQASRLPAPPQQYLESPDKLEAVVRNASQIAALARELTSAWDATTSSDEINAETLLQQATARLHAVRKRREALARAHTTATSLSVAIRDARVDIVSSEFARLGPLAQDIYSRMDPHPTFQDIDLVSETFRSAGTTVAQVRDAISGINADPMLVFSSAQANIAAISYLMALNLASAANAPILLLDDPLQAMDDVNVLGFADLCRHVRSTRQLFVSTHERRFAQLLERKLAPRQNHWRTVALEFVGWDRTGPTIKPRDVQSHTTLASAFRPPN